MQLRSFYRRAAEFAELATEESGGQLREILKGYCYGRASEIEKKLREVKNEALQKTTELTPAALVSKNDGTFTLQQPKYKGISYQTIVDFCRNLLHVHPDQVNY